jgi:hypothetical protein
VPARPTSRALARDRHVGLLGLQAAADRNVAVGHDEIVIARQSANA